MRRIVLLLALAVLALHVANATSMRADPERKDLCGVWYGEIDDMPVVLDLRPGGFSHLTQFSGDGRVSKRAFTWLCLPHGELRFQMEQAENLLILPIEGSLANRNSWEKLVVTCAGDAFKTEKRRIDFRRLSMAELKLGPILAAIEQAEKKTNTERSDSP